MKEPLADLFAEAVADVADFFRDPVLFLVQHGGSASLVGVLAGMATYARGVYQDILGSLAQFSVNWQFFRAFVIFMVVSLVVHLIAGRSHRRPLLRVAARFAARMILWSAILTAAMLVDGLMALADAAAGNPHGLWWAVAWHGSVIYLELYHIIKAAKGTEEGARAWLRKQADALAFGGGLVRGARKTADEIGDEWGSAFSDDDPTPVPPSAASAATGADPPAAPSPPPPSRAP